MEIVLRPFAGLPADSPKGKPRRAHRAETRAAGAAPVGRAASAICAAVLAVEVLGSLLLWAPIPYAWMWVGGRVYAATGSLFADGIVALAGFAVTTGLTIRALNRLDRAWVVLRRRAGRNQSEGALTRVVVVSATLGLLAFVLWYYAFSKAFLLPFMPSR